MKLNSAQMKKTLAQVDADVLPDDHPATSQLTTMFGDHTFFVDDGGLKVLEPADTPEVGIQSGELVSLADWTDATRTTLRPHDPQPTGTIIYFAEVRH